MFNRSSRIMGATLMLAFGAYAEDTAGPKVEFSGFLDADVAATYDQDAGKLFYQNNHEADLVANVKLSDKAVVSLGVTSYTLTSVPAGGTPVVDSASGLTRWPSVFFDGVWASYEVNDNVKLLAGDFTVAEGVFSFYTYKRPLYYGSVMKETYFRGLGVDVMGASLYVGASDTSNSTSDLYVSYAYANEKLEVKPFIFAALDMEGAPDMKAGVSGKLTLGDHSISATYGFLKDDHLDASQTIKIEAMLALGNLSVAGSAFYAFTAKEEAKVTPVDVPEESFFYVEPDYKFSDLLTAGSTFEVHTRAKGVKDSDLDVFPTLYVNPAEQFSVAIWAGPTFYLDGDADPIVSFGSEVTASF